MGEGLLKGESRVFSRISVRVTGYHDVRVGGLLTMVTYPAFGACRLTIVIYTAASGYLPLGAFGPCLYKARRAEESLVCRVPV